MTDSAAATGKQVYFRLLGYVKPYWKIFSFSLIAMIALAIAEPLKAALMKPLLDTTFVEKDPDMLVLMPMMLIGLFAFSGIAQYISTVSLAWVANKVVMDLREQMLNRILALPSQYFSDNTSGGLLSKMNYDVGQVRAAATNVLIVVVRDTLTIIGLLAWMLYLDWKMTLMVFVIAPLIALVVKAISHRMRNNSHSLQDAMGDMTHIAEEAVNGNRVIKVFDGQAYETKRFNEATNWVRRFEMKITNTSAANVPVVQLIAASALAVIIYIGSKGTMTVGAFVSFIAAMAMLSSPIKRLTSINEHLQRGIAAAESVFKLIDQHPEPDTGSRQLDRAQGTLQFNNVSLHYANSESTALNAINLSIQAGETLALVGRSGSGKTSLVNLIPRFYQPTAGQLLIDGIDITDIRLADLRRNLALVTQEVVLFNDTIANNIAYGLRQDASRDDIIAAAKAAHAMEFIEQLPNGLDTLIGEKGARLSGGQRQRLAIARAILKDAPILILDEATSALDTESERHVQAALENLKRGRTTIMIAHRLSTIENADRIIVMEQGHIVESGNHQSLLAANGTYAKLHNMQFCD